jgi:hypothetical protein
MVIYQTRMEVKRFGGFERERAGGRKGHIFALGKSGDIIPFLAFSFKRPSGLPH